MTPITVSQTGTGRSAVVAVDNFTNPFNIGLYASLTGTATYNIEISPDDPMDAGYVASSATWIAAPSFSALTATTVGAMTVPAKAISINITANTGTVSLKIMQAGLR
jgi:hypothetical protein